MGDSVNNPSHYTSHPSGVECIAITEHLGFCIGNAIKYLWRAGLKDGAAQLEDLAKAEWYIGREIDRLGGASQSRCHRENLKAAETLLAELRRVNERAAELQAMNNRQRDSIWKLQDAERRGRESAKHLPEKLLVAMPMGLGKPERKVWRTACSMLEEIVRS